MTDNVRRLTSKFRLMSEKITRGYQINWNQVFYFSEIASLGSVKSAAEKLGVTPSTLSEHLSRLELDLQVKLFRRQHRKLELTAEGARLFQYARQMFETGRRFIDVISPTPLGCYPVSIGLIPGSSYSFAHGIIRNYINHYSDASVNILRYLPHEMETALIDTKLDFGFSDRRSDRKNIIQHCVASSDLEFFISSRVTKRDFYSAFKTLPLAVCKSERGAPTTIEDVLDTLGIKPCSTIVSEYPSIIEHLCRDGSAIAVLGRKHFENDPNVRPLRLPREFPNFSENLYVMWTVDAENSEAIKRLKPLLSS